MICEVRPDVVDWEGTRTSRPRWDRHRFGDPTYPLGYFIRAELRIRCNSIEEIRAFLRSCTYVTDKEQFNKDDYWLSPDRFEVGHKGDCEDHALWAWRQLIHMGYECRLVLGRVGELRRGHAWVAYEDSGKYFFLEATAAWWRNPFPSLWFMRYHPEISIRWNGKKLEYYEHRPNSDDLSLKQILRLGPDYAGFLAILAGMRITYVAKRVKHRFKRLISWRHAF